MDILPGEIFLKDFDISKSKNIKNSKISLILKNRKRTEDLIGKAAIDLSTNYFFSSSNYKIKNKNFFCNIYESNSDDEDAEEEEKKEEKLQNEESGRCHDEKDKPRKKISEEDEKIERDEKIQKGPNNFKGKEKEGKNAEKKRERCSCTNFGDALGAEEKNVQEKVVLESKRKQVEEEKQQKDEKEKAQAENEKKKNQKETEREQINGSTYEKRNENVYKQIQKKAEEKTKKREEESDEEEERESENSVLNETTEGNKMKERPNKRTKQKRLTIEEEKQAKEEKNVFFPSCSSASSNSSSPPAFPRSPSSPSSCTSRTSSVCLSSSCSSSSFPSSFFPSSPPSCSPVSSFPSSSPPYRSSSSFIILRSLDTQSIQRVSLKKLRKTKSFAASFYHLSKGKKSKKDRKEKKNKNKNRKEKNKDENSDSGDLSSFDSKREKAKVKEICEENKQKKNENEIEVEEEEKEVKEEIIQIEAEEKEEKFKKEEKDTQAEKNEAEENEGEKEDTDSDLCMKEKNNGDYNITNNNNNVSTIYKSITESNKSNYTFNINSGITTKSNLLLHTQMEEDEEGKEENEKEKDRKIRSDTNNNNNESNLFKIIQTKISSENIKEKNFNLIQNKMGWRRGISILKKVVKPLGGNTENVEGQNNLQNISTQSACLSPSNQAAMDRAPYLVSAKVNLKTFVELTQIFCVQKIQVSRAHFLCLSFSYDKLLFAAGDQNGYIYIWFVLDEESKNINEEERKKKKKNLIISEECDILISAHSDAVMSIQWAATDDCYRFISTSLQKNIKIFDVKKKNKMAFEICKIECADFPSSAIFHPLLQNIVYVGCLDATVDVWNLKKKTKEKNVLLPTLVEKIKVSDLVTAISVSPNGAVLVVGLKSGSIVFYEANTLKFRSEVDCRNRRGKNSCGRKVSSLMWSEDGRALCVTTSDSRIRILDANDLSVIAKFKGHQNEQIMLQASFDKKEEHVVCGSENGFVYMWDINNTHIPAVNPKFRLTKRKRPTNFAFEAFRAFEGGILSCCCVVPEEICCRVMDKIAFKFTENDSTLTHKSLPEAEEESEQLQIHLKKPPLWMIQKNGYTAKDLCFVVASSDGQIKFFINFGDTLKR